MNLTNFVAVSNGDTTELLCTACAERVYGDVPGMEIEQRYTWQDNSVDAPNHCNYCVTNNELLEQDLTPDGVVYVRSAIVEQLTAHGYLVWPLDVWFDRWGDELAVDQVIEPDGVDFGTDGVDDVPIVFDGYVEALLFTGRFAWLAAGVDEPIAEDSALDNFFGTDDLPASVTDLLRVNVDDFLMAVEPYMPLFPNSHRVGPHSMGCDLAFTAGRQGAGFWDEGLGDLGTFLTHAAHVFGGTAALSGSVILTDPLLPDPQLLSRDNMRMSTLSVELSD